MNGEGRDNEDTFDKRCQNDGEHEDRSGSTRVAAGGFGGLEADQADADGSAKSREGDVGQDHGCNGVLLFPAASTVFAMVRPLKGLVGVIVAMVIAVVADQLDENRAEKCEDQRLNAANQQLHEIERKGRGEGELLGHQGHQ
jgi:hypothetical protein